MRRARSRRAASGPAAAAVLAALAAGVYAGSLGAPFVFDDVPSILENPYLGDLWPLHRALRSPDHVESSFAGRPVASLTLAAKHALGGLEVWSYHALQIAVHALNALLLLGVVRRTLESPRLGPGWSDAAPALAFAAAALWAVHPLLSEAVVYASARSELLVAGFGLGALYAAIRAFEGGRGRRAWTGLAVACAWLAVGSKENAASFPPLILLHDRTFVSGRFAVALQRHAALHAGVFASWLPLAALVAARPRGKTVGLDLGLGPLEYLATQAGVLLHYLRLALWPHPRRFLYDWPPAHGLVDALPELAAVGALAAATLLGLARRPAAAHPGACFFLLLAPTSSVVPIVSEIAAEKRMYLPLAALAAGAVAAAWAAAGACARRPASPAGRRARALALAGLLAWAALAAGTLLRVRDYRSELSLWTDTVRKAPGHPWAHNNLGVAYRQQGDLARAEAHFRAALALRPSLAPAWVNLGNLLLARGDLAAAVGAYREAVARLPDAVEVHYHLGLGLARLGRVGEALPHFEEAVRIHPRHRFARIALARTYERLGQPERAREHAAVAEALER